MESYSTLLKKIFKFSFSSVHNNMIFLSHIYGNMLVKFLNLFLTAPLVTPASKKHVRRLPGGTRNATKQ